MLDARRYTDLLEVVNHLTFIQLDPDVGRRSRSTSRKRSAAWVSSAIHQDVHFTGEIAKAVCTETERLAFWLGMQEIDFKAHGLLNSS